jgi:hypothetical protein
MSSLVGRGSSDLSNGNERSLEARRFPLQPQVSGEFPRLTHGRAEPGL